MNQYTNLKAGVKNIALFGITKQTWDLALNLAQAYEVLIADFLALQDENTPCETNLRQAGNFRFCQRETELEHTGVYYVDGFHLSNHDWSKLKSVAKLIGHSLRKGDWIVFAPKSNPDLMETLILERVMELSGLRLGIDFQVSFCPKLVDQAYFQNSSAYLKISHNLIVGEVKKIFNPSVEGRSLCTKVGRAV